MELWISYCDYTAELFSDNKEYVRSIFERAAEMIGTDFNCFEFWNGYIGWEEKLGNGISAVNSLYTRLGPIPHFKYEHIVAKYNSFLEKMPDHDLINLYQEVTGEAMLAAPQEMRSRIKEKFNASSESTKQRLCSKKIFEDNLFNFEFDGKPVDETQKEWWFKYFEFEAKFSSKDDVFFLLERALAYLVCFPFAISELSLDLGSYSAALETFGGNTSTSWKRTTTQLTSSNPTTKPCAR